MSNFKSVKMYAGECKQGEATRHLGLIQKEQVATVYHVVIGEKSGLVKVRRGMRALLQHNTYALHDIYISYFACDMLLTCCMTTAAFVSNGTHIRMCIHTYITLNKVALSMTMDDFTTVAVCTHILSSVLLLSPLLCHKPVSTLATCPPLHPYVGMPCPTLSHVTNQSPYLLRCS